MPIPRALARRLPATLAVALLTACLGPPAARADMTRGAPEIRSLSALAFAPDGTLFVGDGRGGSVWAVTVDEGDAPAEAAKPQIHDIEGQIAARLGTSPEQVMIHDLAAHPVSQNVYLAVSRGRGAWTTRWLLPNDVSDAEILLRVTPDGAIEVVELTDVPFARADLPNPVSPDKTHPWKDGVSLRADTITDMAYDDGTLYVAGLSNEEFASTLWKLPFPFAQGASATTLEIYHGAHGAYETHAPIRTFLPYDLDGERQLLAAYLCTPLVTFPAAALADGAHVKGRTVAEFGSGNYPLDMIVYRKNGEDRLLIANSNLPMMIVDPRDIAAYEGEIAEPLSEYVAGVPYEPRSGTGLQQMDKLNDEYLVALARLPGGALDLVSVSFEWF